MVIFQIISVRKESNLTNCLRVIRNAWHFWYALVLVVKVICRSIGIALLTP
ncbi:DUF3265 domain-containing protein [Vibrio vulnificus]|nr:MULTISPECIES: DUF3265 domain-containing protein [Vibrio diabolicus subgroup]EGQ7819255.1 DUF3265 domain-containing protein [Vibrio parahaemolyticus]EGQ9303546.1 DUF3265 domain-containing protein [Vibrio vulnificus]EGR1465988.1 DUF3265 domain-containing protein [Vibrio cholerae]PAR33874.1 DUF3265 domain-containing protein [Vibrio metoecus]EGQ7900836.1 DUF3265 domain-containing protein [Vibrio parahaemolyticus]